MKQGWMSATVVAWIVGCTVSQTAIAQQAKSEIIHDAEYYIMSEIRR
jgi:hypothetical protein